MKARRIVKEMRDPFTVRTLSAFVSVERVYLSALTINGGGRNYVSERLHCWNGKASYRNDAGRRGRKLTD